MSEIMKEIVALCKRRGFVYPASEIYGGINGFWDYGPLGVELKNNIRDLWWQAMVKCPPIGPDGEPVSIYGLDASIIQNPKSWEASGHVGGFSDPMVDCRETKLRYRADHLFVLRNIHDITKVVAFVDGTEEDAQQKKLKKLNWSQNLDDYKKFPFTTSVGLTALDKVVGPDAKEPGTLTEPKQFNLMFHTFVGAAAGDENKAYLRPETCGPIFLNFSNVVDSSRARIPFGIAQIGKAFRNEVTPRNFVFRSREFEQMELEWFCEEKDVPMWFEFWLDQRKSWWKSIGINMDHMYSNEIDKKELAHYSQRTVDLEYKFPFTAPGYGELEGIAHRGNFDLTQHEKFSGNKMDYFDQINNQRFKPHVIEPSTGLTRALLTVLCEAYTPDPNRPSGVYLNFHPAVAPIKAAILPLTAKDEHPKIATDLYLKLRNDYMVDLDIKQNIGKRYARHDEIGTPFCFTIDDQTVADKTVTVRHRNTMKQERIALDQVPGYLATNLKAF
jgi:glycyl-tRNA synthetase